MVWFIVTSHVRSETYLKSTHSKLCFNKYKKNSFLRDVLESAQNSLYISSSILALSTFQLFSIISHKFLKLKLFRITRSKDNPFMKKNNSFWKKLEYLFQQMRGFVVEKTNWSEGTKTIRRLRKVGPLKVVLKFSVVITSQEVLESLKWVKLFYHN